MAGQINDEAVIRTISVDFTLSGEKRHPTAIAARMSINSYPTITVTHHINTDEFVNLGSDDVCKDMGERQKQLFTEDQAKATLSMTDGQGGSLSFTGMVMSPSYMFSAYSVDLSDTLLPEYAKMDAVNLNFYAPGKVTADTTNNSHKDVPRLKDSGSVPMYAWAVYEKMRSVWEKSRPAKGITFPVSRTAEEEQDRINQVGLKFYKELLESSVSTFGWEDLPDLVSKAVAEYADNSIYECFNTTYANNSGSFFSTICRIAEEFQCLYVPEWDKVGKLVNRNTLMDNEESISVEVSDLHLQVGGQGMFPVRYVAVSGEVKSTETTMNKQVTNSYVVYPESQVNNGSMIPKQAPKWMPVYAYKAELKSPGKNVGASRSPEAVTSKLDKEAGKAEEREKAQMGILQKWAKSCYIWEALGNTTATITVPLNFGVKLGVRYKVQNREGKHLFSGYLTDVDHKITSAENGRGLCHTQLGFTHVTLPGFTLPE